MARRKWKPKRLKQTPAQEAAELRYLIASQKRDLIKTLGKLEYMARNPSDIHDKSGLSNHEVLTRMEDRGKFAGRSVPVARFGPPPKQPSKPPPEKRRASTRSPFWKQVEANQKKYDADPQHQREFRQRQSEFKQGMRALKKQQREVDQANLKQQREMEELAIVHAARSRI